MSPESPIHEAVHARLTREFGEPSNVLGKDAHWTLRPDGIANSINLLVDGSLETPAIWIFDPHDRTDSVFRSYIRDEAHLEEIIKSILKRMHAANRPKVDGGSDGFRKP